MKKEMRRLRFLSIFLALLLVIQTWPLVSGQTSANAFGETVTDYTYTIDSIGNATITKYTGSGGDVVIPSEIEGHTVTTIAPQAFTVSGINSVTIPDSVTTLEGGWGVHGAFYGCDLKSVTIPDSVTYLGQGTFMSCPQLSEVFIPASVKTINPETFYACTSLKNVFIENGITNIAGATYSYMESFLGAFQNCTSLEFISIPDSVTNIGAGTFKDCTSLKSVNIGSGIKSIGGRYGYVGSGVWPNPPNGAFYNCEQLSTVNIEGDLSSIGVGAFLGTSITSIKLGNVTEISDHAFSSCRSLQNVTIPDGVTNIGTNAFSGCGSLTNITIPSSVISIGEWAFAGCGLTSINLPSSVTSIGNRTFDVCTSLTSFAVDSGNPIYSSLSGVLYNKGQTTLIKYPAGKAGAFTIPSSVLSIEVCAFYCCSSLTSITIPNSVTSIGPSAFLYCTGLTSVTIPSSVTSIEAQAFSYCYYLTAITFNSPTTSIYDITNNYNDPSTIPRDATIYGYEPSTAKNYALKFGNRFILISGEFGAQAEQDLRRVDELAQFNYSPNVYSKDLALKAAQYAALAGDGYVEGDFNGNLGNEGGYFFDGGDTWRTGQPLYLIKKLIVNEGFENVENYNYHDKEQDNVSFVIADRFVNYNDQKKREIVIAISGTDGEEWLGNMNLTGVPYDESKEVHLSFDMAKADVLTTLAAYQETYGITEDCVLFITGHSRGAAVANLVAEQIALEKGGTLSSDYHVGDVFAYTFATPNVQKHANVDRPNIFNFCFEDDIVPQIPLESWGYDKNGKTFTAAAWKLQQFNEDFRNAVDKSVYWSDGSHDYAHFSAYATPFLVGYMGGIWKSTNDYYNKWTSLLLPRTLYEYMTYCLAPAAVKGNDIEDARDCIFQTNAFCYPITTHFIDFEIGWLNTRDKVITVPHQSYQVNDTHQMYTYYYALLYDGFNTSTSPSQSPGISRSLGIESLGEIGIYNEQEVQQLRAFASQEDNAAKLGWNLADPSSWSGVVWSLDQDSHVTSFNLGYMDLTGSLGLSGFPQLTTVDVSGNGISGLSIENCPGLKNVKCPYNQLPQIAITGTPALETLDCRWNQVAGLELATFSNLKQLYCGNNMVSSLDLTSNPLLLDLYCESNELTALDLSSNTQLISVNCEGNYLDIQGGTNLRTNLEGVLAKTGGWSLFESQKIPEAAMFKVEDAATLTTFASQDENLTKLQWDLADPKTWYGIEWTLSGNEYAVKGINFDNLNLTGNLNLQGMTSLNQLSCSGNLLNSLDVSGCSSLNYLSCSDTGLETINLTGCLELLVLECANNYLDISEGTALYNTILSIAGNEGSRVKYTPQKIKAAVGEFDANEVATLTAFANNDSNQSLLQWNPEMPGDWAGVEWAYLDGKYHAVSIDISFRDVAGTLDLSGFTSLLSLDCGSTAISSVALPESMTVVEESMFYDCGGLTTIYLPDTLTDIKSLAFYGCNALTQISIPDGVVAIGSAAFASCSSLTSITLPASIEAIGENCFYGCTGLSTVMFKSETTNIYDNENAIPSTATIRGYEGSTAQFFSSKYSRVFETMGTLCVVTFNSQGGSAVGELSSDYNTTISAPTNPTKTGYTFEGWYQEPSCSNMWTFESDKVLSSMTLYAYWSPISYDITYFTNGGINSDSNPTVYTAEASIVHLIAPTKIGHTFNGWYSDSGFTGQVVTSIPAGSFGDISLYAKWIPNTYTIAFNGNGATSGSMTSLAMTYDVSKALTANVYLKTGYTFSGWATSPTGAVAYANQAAVKNLTGTNNGTATLYAKWTPNAYTIAFNGNGATSGSMTSLAMTYDAVKSLPANTFAKTGYSFAGWATSPTGAVAYTNQAVVKNLTATKKGSATLYAKWIPNTYNIKFNINVGTSGTMSSLAMTYDSTKSLTANTFKKTGFSFLGWATTSTGAVVYKDLAAVKNLTATKGATINLYAKWGASITSAASYNYTSIKVSWAYAGSATSYKVYRATSASGTYSLVYTAASTARSWVDTGQTTGKTYYYKVYPVAGGKTYTHSTYKYAKAVPATPSVSLSKSTSTSIKVTWSGVSGASGYQIYRATSSTRTYSLVYTASSSARYWVNTGRTFGSTYYYKVRAYHIENSIRVYGSFSSVRYLQLQ